MLRFDLMKFFIRLLILLAGILFAIVFTITNPGKTDIDLFIYQGAVPVPLLVFVSVFIGALLAWSYNILGNFKKNMQTRQLRKKLELSETEISNLRKLPIKDEH